MSNAAPPTSDEVEKVTCLGDGQYEAMEPALTEAHLGEYVAIHVDTREYTIGRSAKDAVRKMRERRAADGRVYIRRIGRAPETELAPRLGLAPTVEKLRK